MRKKYKLTAFSRLVIFMIFFAPAAYIGVSYYNGEDGVEKIKTLINNKTSKDPSFLIEAKKEKIQKLEEKIDNLKKEVEQLETEQTD